MSETQRPRRFTFAAFLSVFSLLLLGGCAADNGFTPTVTSVPGSLGQTTAPTATAPAIATVNPNAPIAVSVILTDYRISSFTNQYQVGKVYQFSVTNNGGVVHGFTIEADGSTSNTPLSENGHSATIASINPGETVTLTWTFTAAGKLQLASHLNDDFAKGMTKTGITVS